MMPCNLNEAVRDGCSGYFVPPDNPDMIASRLRQVTGDPVLRAEMALQTRALFEERFTIDHYITLWTESMMTAIPKRADSRS